MLHTLNEFLDYYGLSKQERQTARRNILNAVKDISPSFSINPKTTKFIIDSGEFNVIAKINNNHYRIYYKKIDNDLIHATKRTYDVISKHDYGILPPISVKINKSFIYGKIRLAEYFQGAEYNKLHDLLKKALNITKHGLLFTDFHPYNIAMINGKPVIVDYDMMEEKDIPNIIQNSARLYNIELSSMKTTKKCTPAEKKAIEKVCKRNIDHNIFFYYVCAMVDLIAYAKGYTDCHSYSRLHLNHILWLFKFNAGGTQWSHSRYEFLMKTPFGLL